MISDWRSTKQNIVQTLDSLSSHTADFRFPLFVVLTTLFLKTMPEKCSQLNSFWLKKNPKHTFMSQILIQHTSQLKRQKCAHWTHIHFLLPYCIVNSVIDQWCSFHKLKKMQKLKYNSSENGHSLTSSS